MQKHSATPCFLLCFVFGFSACLSGPSSACSRPVPDWALAVAGLIPTQATLCPIHPWALLRSFLGLLYPPKSLRWSSCPPSPRSLALPVWSSLIPLSSWAPTAPTVWVIEARAALCYFPLISSMLTHSLQLHQKVKNQSLAFSQNPEHWHKANNLENSVLLVDWNNDWPGLHQSTEGLAEMFPQAYWGPILEDTVGIFHIWVHTFTRS